MIVYSIIIFFLYFGMLVYIIPNRGVFFDLYKRKFRLLPVWFKRIALVWLILSALIILILKPDLDNTNVLLLSNFNLALFMFYFSKRKNEDEFSEQVRFKAFTYSFISFVAMSGAFGALNIADDSNWSNLLVHLFFSGGLAVATVYFYATIYKARN